VPINLQINGAAMTTATVLSGPERRRRWTRAEKARIVEESLATAENVAEVARRHDVHPNLLHAWRRQARTGRLAPGHDAGIAPTDGHRFSRVVVASEGGVPRAARSDAGAGVAMIEVVLRNGRLLRVPEDAAPTRVVALAEALEGSGR
jgi:transposase